TAGRAGTAGRQPRAVAAGPPGRRRLPGRVAGAAAGRHRRAGPRAGRVAVPRRQAQARGGAGGRGAAEGAAAGRADRRHGCGGRTRADPGDSQRAGHPRHLHRAGRAPDGRRRGTGRPDGGHAPRRAVGVRHPAAGDGRRHGAVGVPGGAAVILQVDGLDVVLGESHVLHGVSFEVRQGGVTALLGRNGAGKTTTLRALLALVPATGSVRLAGQEVSGELTYEIVRRGVGYVPEDREVFAGLTVQENLRLAERPGGP